jgi:hypothetical protein
MSGRVKYRPRICSYVHGSVIFQETARRRRLVELRSKQKRLFRRVLQQRQVRSMHPERDVQRIAQMSKSEDVVEVRVREQDPFHIEILGNDVVHHFTMLGFFSA